MVSTQECTFATCDTSLSSFGYEPNNATSEAFLAIFGLLFFAHLIQGWRHRKVVVTFLMVAGHFLFTFAFFERSFGNNPYGQGTFITWLFCQLIGSSAILLGIYLASSSMLSTYTDKIFGLRLAIITATLILSELTICGLQAAGGYLGAEATDKGQRPWPELGLYIAGQSLQLVLLFCFILYMIVFSQMMTFSSEKREGWLKWKTARVELGIFVFCYSCYAFKAMYQLVLAASGWTNSAANTEVLFILFQTFFAFSTHHIDIPTQRELANRTK
ncbi:hypothetical protein B0J13DRAFT_631148 [Dactylonectria estremocensis]|uniref:Uncharacterized protein n=1 Tax=Dactylonectria estremocensis TaxID=1079267 RepID=A0A9P9D6N8_9HYPO|nr:hypothetical protein B0J13DRAFT_662252 [Dactylonectria estremocensis]KAH7113698.1 hypothetical protein B0J13DRAFT_631148 [Dactylonectria estremocensis]